MIFDLDGTPPNIGFPDTHLAESDPNGLLAIGGDLSTRRLVEAARRREGIDAPSRGGAA